MTGTTDRHQHDRELDGLTLHEERLVVSDAAQTRAIGEVTVRKRIVVEEVTVTVPVRREVVEVVRRDADGHETVLGQEPAAYEPRVEDRTLHSGRAEASPEAPQAARETRAVDGGIDLVCYEERPVLTTELYAVERVRLELTRTTEAEQVVGEVRREVAELEQTESPRV